MRSTALNLPDLRLRASADAYDLGSHTYRSVNENLWKGSKLTTRGGGDGEEQSALQVPLH